MSRGPYKQYEYDPGISIPKTTNHYRRKRQIEEVEQDLSTTEIGNVDSYENINMDEVINLANITDMYVLVKRNLTVFPKRFIGV